MKYYASRTGTRRNIAVMKACGWGWMVGPLDMGGPVREGMPHAVDNGAWPAFQAFLKGKRPTPMLDLRRFMATVRRHGSTADFIIVPDIVQGGMRSWALTRAWLRRLRRMRQVKRVPLLLAVQDGMQPDLVRRFLGPLVGIFVGGSTEWKLATMKMWCDLAHACGAICHVGRINTARRMEAAGDAGADSGDGLSGSRFAVTVMPLDRARREVVLRRAQISIFDHLEVA